MGERQSYKGVVTFTFEFSAGSEPAAEQFARSKIINTLDQHALDDTFEVEDISVVRTIESEIERELEQLERELEG